MSTIVRQGGPMTRILIGVNVMLYVAWVGSNEVGLGFIRLNCSGRCAMNRLFHSPGHTALMCLFAQAQSTMYAYLFISHTFQRSHAYAFEQKLSSSRNWKYSFSYNSATSLVLMDARDPRRTCRTRGLFDHRLTAFDHPRPFGGPTEHTQLAPVCSQPSPHQEKSIWLISAY